MTKAEQSPSARRLATIGISLLLLAPGPCPPAPRFAGPTSSQPLALSADGAFLVAVNPDNDSASFFDLRQDRNRRVAQVPVQREPNGAAFLPDGTKAYVANTVSGTVSVIRTRIANGVVSRPTLHIPVGTEPYGLATTPNGTKLYVSNARSNTISVIDTASDTVIRTIPGVGPEPRGLGITNDGDGDDLDETLYVTQFLSLPRVPGRDGADDAKSGFVTVIDTATDTVSGVVELRPLADTGFKAAGDALAKIKPGPSLIYRTGAYPNQLNNVAIKNGFAYVPNTGASPNGPLRFDVNLQSLVHVIDRTTAADAGRTLNLQQAIASQTNPSKRFASVPWAMAFEHGRDAGFVASAASNVLVKLTVDAATGAAAVAPDPSDPTRVLEISTGKNPRGIVVNAADTRAYVANQVSRDITIVDLTTSPERALGTIASAGLPAPGTIEDQIHVGRELYNTSIGDFDAPAGPGRMSESGWGSCAGCHPFGLSDNVVWISAAGPRRTLPQHADFQHGNLPDPAQRKLDWSADRDEQADFELNIRQVSGGQGLIVLDDGVTPDPDVVNLFSIASDGEVTGQSSGRNQVTVRGVPAWDALEAFVRFGIRAPISPISDADPQVVAGRALFEAAACQRCHGGAQWTRSAVTGYVPPPNPLFVKTTQLVSELAKVGTFDASFFNEVRASAGPAPLGADGFVPPSLLSGFAFPGAFLHNGAAASLDDVLANVTHRKAGTGVDTLANPADRAAVVQFLLSIDAVTPPIEAQPPCTFVAEWGHAGSGEGEFDHPGDIAVDADGDVYVTDMDGHRVQKFTNDGTFLTQWGRFGTAEGEFDTPIGIGVDGSGNVFVADFGNSRVQKFTSAGTFLTQWGTFGTGDGQFKGSQGLGVDANGDVYVGDPDNNRVQKFANDGTYLTQWGSFGSGDTQLNSPKDIRADANGDLYVADQGNNQVKKFTNTGTFLAKWGSGGRGEGQFINMVTPAVDQHGNVYVSEHDVSNPVQKFTSDGIFVGKLGSAGSGDGQFSAALGMAFDGNGNLFVVDGAEAHNYLDPNNHRIQKFACP